jgi:hypothetical protein
MFISNQKEQFNVAYVHAMASQAGLNTGNMKVDDQSIDLDVDGKMPDATKNRFPKISLQLKATSLNVVKNGVIKFSLHRKNYNDLKNDRLIVPRYLVVLLVPKHPSHWIQHHDAHMSLHNTCYWASIKDDPAVKGKGKVTVHIPLSQRLDTDTLVYLIKLASEGKFA